MPVKVLDVGQCDLDNYLITQMLRQHFQAEVTRVRTHGEAEAALADQTYDLVLINRINDADGTPGLQLIHSLKGNPATQGTRLMLVSNYAEAQAEAVSAGASPGFGKSELGEPQTIQRLRACLDVPSSLETLDP